MGTRTRHLLLVEDNPADANLLRMSLEDAGFQSSIIWLTDGEDAVAYVRQEGEHKAQARAHFAILDLCLPRKDGFEVLDAIRASSDLESIPVVILTTSFRNDDILRASRYQDVRFITKPGQLSDYEALAAELVQWERQALSSSRG